MPLIQKKSKKAFEHNVKAEMESGKPQKQSLAIAFSVQRKPKKKKMAEGGEVKDSAKQEPRPMPKEVAKDSKEVSHNRSQKAASQDKMTDQPERMQAGKGKTFPLKHPSMAKSDAFSTKLRDEEDHLQSYAKPMFEGGAVSEEASEADHAPKITIGDGDDMEKGPAQDEFMADHFADGGSIDPKGVAEGARQGGSLSDAWNGLTHPKWAEGGEVTERADELDSQEPVQNQHFHSEEEALDHASSIVAAVMSKRKKMAEGGRVDIEENGQEEPNGFYKRNEDEVLKENYDDDFKSMSQPEDSNEDGREIEHDKHDMLSEVRAKMKRRLK